VTLSPDGKRLACSGGSGVVQITDLPSGKASAVLRGHKEAPWIGFVGSGNRIASASDGVLVFWNAESGKEIRREKDVDGTPVVIAGQTLLAPFFTPPSAGSLRLFDREGILLRTFNLSLKKKGKGLYCVPAADPAGKRAFAYMDFLTGDLEEDIFSKDQEVLVSWDLSTGKEPWRSQGAEYLCAFTPDGRAFVSFIMENEEDPAGTIRFRESETGALIREWRSHEQNASAMRFLDEGKCLAVAGSGRITLWSFPEGKSLADREVLPGGMEFLSPWKNGRYLIAGSRTGERIAIVELPGLETAAVLKVHEETLRGLEKDPNKGFVVSVDRKGAAALLKTSEETGKEIQ